MVMPATRHRHQGDCRPDLLALCRCAVLGCRFCDCGTLANVVAAAVAGRSINGDEDLPALLLLLKDVARDFGCPARGVCGAR